MTSKSTFLTSFLRNPRRVGSVAPSSKNLARHIADVVDQMPSYEVIELGAGSGAISSELIAYRPTLVEIDETLSESLRIAFPMLQVVCGCAISFLQNLEQPNGLILSIPTINNPDGVRLISTLKRCYQLGLIPWCVTYSYGPFSPLRNANFQRQSRHSLVLGNLPPAFVWSYA